MRQASSLLLAGLLGLVLPGCKQAVAPSGSANVPAPSTCAAFDALVDLASSLQTSAAFGASSSLFYLVDTDEDLGHLHIAERELRKLSSADADALRQEIEHLDTSLTTLRERMNVAWTALEKTGTAAEVALDTAAMCQGVDLRDYYKVVGANGVVAKTDPATREKTRADHEAKVASKACEGALRLWTATRQVDLTTAVSSSSVASHVKELTLPGSTASVRDRLADSLAEHAQALRQFDTIAKTSHETPDPATLALTELQSDLIKRLEVTNRTCRSHALDLARTIGGEPEPRQATVTVRPKWSGPLATLNHPEEFGSGFVVRWRNGNGELETRIVTNNHVMDGAFEADILPGDPHQAKAPDPTNDKPQAWSATLVQANPHDDVAVLKLAPEAQRVFPEGFSLRLTPPREEEVVAAAGFPGVGMHPSFQVTRGTISNAKFGAENPHIDPFDIYIQHTAAIDPGNSGGPLLDAHGKLIGMNTLKLVGRENVGLAIPTWRIREALVWADDPIVLDEKYAEASCNAVVAALASSRPVAAAASRFGLALYDWAKKQPSNAMIRRNTDLQEGSGDPVDQARREVFRAIRNQVDDEGGVRPFEACSGLHAGDTPGSMTATFHSRTGVHTLTLGEEHSVVRVTTFQ